MEAIASRRKRQLNRKQLLILVIMLCAMLLMLISFAWYYFKVDKEVDSEQADVMAPYYLYLLDGEGDNLSLSIGSLHPGETKQVIIGVSNKPAGELESTVDYLIGKNSKFDYKLALAYTQNLPITYTVYELKETDEEKKEFTVTDPSDNISLYLEKVLMSKDVNGSAILTQKNNEAMYQDEVAEGKSIESVVNYVQYDLYPYDSSYQGNSSSGDSAATQSNLRLETKIESDGNTSYELDYYLIEMKWKDDIEFQNFIKETDLVYVIVDAVQPKPEAQEEIEAQSEAQEETGKTE